MRGWTTAPSLCRTRRAGAGRQMFLNRILAIQIVIVGLCIFALAELALNFPYPSPLIQPLLPPKVRWPTAQVEHWVETGRFGSGFLEYFARDPERAIPPGNNLVSPADGVIGDVAYRDGITYLIIALSFWDVHVVRTPASGVVSDVEQEGVYFGRSGTRDEFRQSFFLRGKAAPVQQIVTLQTQHGEMKVRLITSYWASRIKVWVHDGERLYKGQRIGRMLLGSTVVLELRGRVALSARVGEHVTGGESIIWRGR